MPIRKDETGKHWVEMHFIVPGTPEQVWQAMATGSGYAAWFTKATIEERVGGVLKFHFGPDVFTAGEVTLWEPPHLFGYVERQWSEGAPPITTEITIAGRSGGRCAVRMVHSMFTSTDDWDDQMEGFEAGWPGSIEVLRIYLANFAGAKAASLQVMHMVQADQSAVWSRLLEKLNLSNSHVGERRRASQPEELSWAVERIHEDQKVRAVTLRLDAPAPGVAIVGTYGSDNGVNASLSAIFYGDTVEAQVATSQAKWQEWLREALSL